MGAVGLEPTNSKEGRFTVFCNCHYAMLPIICWPGRNRTKSYIFLRTDNRVRTYTKTLEEFYAIQLHHIRKLTTLIVLPTRIELVRASAHSILSATCLPIPPRKHYFLRISKNYVTNVKIKFYKTKNPNTF